MIIDNSVYRELHIPRLSKGNCLMFMLGLSVSGAKVTSHFQLTNGFSDKDANKREMFFRLKFDSQEAVSRFESQGLLTSTPEKIGSDPIWLMDQENHR